jgi:hypothetical protein
LSLYLAATVTSGTEGFTTTVATTDAGGVPSSIAIVNVPIPSGACLPEVITCGPTGLDVAFYTNSIISSEAYGNNTLITPDYYFDLVPLGSGRTDSLDVPRVEIPDTNPTQTLGTQPYFADSKTEYAGINYDPNNGTFVFNGYFQPRLSGIHSICVDVDSIDNFYLGSDKAFPCGRTDPIGGATFTLLVPNPLLPDTYCILQVLEAGFLYPIRSVYGMYGLPSYMFTNITFPGDVPMSASNLEGTLYPQACLSQAMPRALRDVPTDVAR